MYNCEKQNYAPENCPTLKNSVILVAELKEGPGGPAPLFWAKKKKSQKEEKPQDKQALDLPLLYYELANHVSTFFLMFFFKQPLDPYFQLLPYLPYSFLAPFQFACPRK